MLKPSPLSLLLTPALFAIASAAHAAAATVGSSSPAPAFSAPTSTTLATSPQASQPSTTSSASSSSTSSAASASGSASAGSGTASFNPMGPVTDAASFGPGSSFSNDNGNPELGLAPGQTSSGTLAGTEPNGLDVGSQTLDTNGTFGGAPAGAGTVAPVDLLGGAVVGGAGGGTSMGGTAIALTPGRALASGRSTTPLLDQATRNAEQRLARERASGRTPRVIGIAPRTDADRTDEMPDDPIIRY